MKAGLHAAEVTGLGGGRQVLVAFSIDTSRLGILSRCSKCNGAFDPGAGAAAARSTPSSSPYPPPFTPQSLSLSPAPHPSPSTYQPPFSPFLSPSPHFCHFSTPHPSPSIIHPHHLPPPRLFALTPP